MTDIVKGMIVVAAASGGPKLQERHMRAALLWLADNVSDEMVDAAAWLTDRVEQYNIKDRRKLAIAAAIRAAAGGGG